MNPNIFFFIFSLSISLVCILFCIMFFTLLERKILSFSQMRYGPNKISMFGLLQPMIDGFKLLLKEFIFYNFQNKFMYILGPYSFLVLMVFLWISLPNYKNFFSFPMSMIFIIICIGMGVYTSLVSGWGSNSKFSMIGSIRAMSQTISYEISLSMMIFCYLILLNSMSLLTFIKMKSILMIFILIPLSIIWWMSLVAECNRAPFDFAEGESELVSGFNTEYSSSLFAFLFIGEYGMIVFFSILTYFLFFSFSSISLIIMSILLSLMLLIRSVYPRFRYDKLMFLSWFKFLPISIFFSIFTMWNSWFL